MADGRGGLAEFTQPTSEEPDGTQVSSLAAELQAIITTAAENAPRSLQADLGPSEAGIPCPRRLAYRILAWDKPPGKVPSGPPGGDPWPAIVGTSIHAWLATTFAGAGGRWLAEQPVTIAPPLLPGGSCDLYDTATDTVIDWKAVGPTSLNTYRIAGPRAQYITQVHLYGLGFELAGRHPQKVAIAFLPRGGYLSGMWLWSAPYDRAHALQALRRLTAIRQLVIAADALHPLETDPAGLALIPAVPSHGCAWCPWYRPGSTDLRRGCAGDLPSRNPPPPQGPEARKETGVPA
jgi:hypothetical protein